MSLHSQRYRVDALVDLYHARWDVEEMFKVSKQFLAIEQFHGRSECLVKQELFAHFGVTPLGDDGSDTTAHSCSVVASAATSTVHHYVATSFGLPVPELAQVAAYSLAGIAPIGWLLAESVLLAAALFPAFDLWIEATEYVERNAYADYRIVELDGDRRRHVLQSADLAPAPAHRRVLPAGSRAAGAGPVRACRLD